MVTSVSKSTIIEDVWKNFYDRIKAEVTTTTLTDTTVITISTSSYVSSFPDQLIDSKSDYPIMVIETPTLGNVPFTMTRSTYEAQIGIEIYTNQAESADKFLSQIIDAIETYKYQLKLVGISRLELDNVYPDDAQRDKIKLHKRRAVFKFKYNYSKTLAY